MSATTAARPASITSSLARLASAARRERTIFRAGAAIVAAHVLDDTLIQPPAGTSPTDHLGSALVPLG